jgi:hypothetical protein
MKPAANEKEEEGKVTMMAVVRGCDIGKPW